MNNQTFARDVVVFVAACELGGVKPTKRQASKWRNLKGTAWKFWHEATKVVARRELQVIA